MKKWAWVLYAAIVAYIVPLELGRQNYLNLHKYAAGLERAPYQQRALFVPVLQWVFHSHWLLARAAHHRGYWHSAENWPIALAAFLSFLICAVCIVRLYSKVSHCGQLGLLVLPLIIYGQFIPCNTGVFLYDLPAMAFFTVGVVCVFEGKFALYWPIFALGTFNRETTIMLVPLMLLLAVPNKAWRRKTAVFAFLYAATWVVERLFVLHRLPGVGSELIINVLPNLRSLTRPFYLIRLSAVFGGLWLPVAFGVRYIRDTRLRWAMWLYPLWFAVMLVRGELSELRIYGELLPLTVLLALIAFESWWMQQSKAPKAAAERIPAETGSAPSQCVSQE